MIGCILASYFSLSQRKPKHINQAKYSLQNSQRRGHIIRLWASNLIISKRECYYQNLMESGTFIRKSTIECKCSHILTASTTI